MVRWESNAAEGQRPKGRQPPRIRTGGNARYCQGRRRPKTVRNRKPPKNNADKTRRCAQTTARAPPHPHTSPDTNFKNTTVRLLPVECPMRQRGAPASRDGAAPRRCSTTEAHQLSGEQSRAPCRTIRCTQKAAGAERKRHPTTRYQVWVWPLPRPHRHRLMLREGARQATLL